MNEQSIECQAKAILQYVKDNPGCTTPSEFDGALLLELWENGLLKGIDARALGHPHRIMGLGATLAGDEFLNTQKPTLWETSIQIITKDYLLPISVAVVAGLFVYYITR